MTSHSSAASLRRIQNGLGPLGQPSPTGARKSKIVEYRPDGHRRAVWRIVGHVDGLGADRRRHQLIATVNEDGNPSLWTIAPSRRGAKPVKYTYSPEPDAAHTGGVHTGGGTEAVQVLSDGRLLISASAPIDGSGGPVPGATATFLATLQRSHDIARLRPTFADDARATDALTGSRVRLGPPGATPEALTDPDSSALVPSSSSRYRYQYMLNSQGDQRLVFARRVASRHPQLTELPLNRRGKPAGADDVVWSTSRRGTFYVTDHKASLVYALRGTFGAGRAVAALDSVGSTADNTEVDRLVLATGTLTPLVTGFQQAKGLLYVPAP